MTGVPGGLELPFLTPEANALSTELQGLVQLQIFYHEKWALAIRFSANCRGELPLEIPMLLQVLRSLRVIVFSSLPSSW